MVLTRWEAGKVQVGVAFVHLKLPDHIMNNGVGHCLEKGKNVLYVLKEIAVATEDASLAPDELRAKIRGLAHLAGHDMTKVMSDVSDTKHDTDEGDKIFTPGEDGIEELLVKYGWLNREPLR